MPKKNLSPPNFGKAVSVVIDNINRLPEMRKCHIYIVLAQTDKGMSLGLYDEQTTPHAISELVFDEKNIMTIEDAKSTDNKIPYTLLFQAIAILLAQYYNYLGYGKLMGYGLIDTVTLTPNDSHVAFDALRYLGFEMYWFEADEDSEQSAEERDLDHPITIDPRMTPDEFHEKYEADWDTQVFLNVNVSDAIKNKAEQLIMHMIHQISAYC